MCRSYSRIYNIKIIGLRFFTVFGEWVDRYINFKYIKSNLDKKIFYLNSNRQHFRDFTYIDDVLNILDNLSSFKFKNNYSI